MLCLYCGNEIGNEFTKRKKFCSHRCGHLYRIKHKDTILNCKNCGIELTQKQIKSKQDFCSIKCVCEYKLKSKNKNCLKCGKALTKKQIWNNRKYCSIKCASSSEEVREKVKKTNVERYGVEHILNDREKVKNSLREKYGVDSPFSCEKIKEKARNTLISKYGVDNVFKLKEIQDKIKNTNLIKYGVTNVLFLDEFKKKIKETLVRKYGVDNILKNNEYRNRAHKKSMMRWYYKIISRFSEYVEPCFSKEEYHGRNHEYLWKCKRCGSLFYSSIYSTSFNENVDLPRCWKCYPRVHGDSRMENEVFDFVKNIYNGNINKNVRGVIDRYELDIYIPDINIAIEFDGMFWHSDLFGKGKDYHFNKTFLCKEKGIHLIHIFEDEWRCKSEIVKDRLTSIICGCKNVIYARKCRVDYVDYFICSKFLNENHLQGEDKSSIRIGLFYENKLVAVMTFGKPRFNKKYEYELIRFSSIIGTRIVGGASKLLNFFINKHNPNNIISYADIRYSDGKMYNSIGFMLNSISSPNYWWCNASGKRLSRYQCQKHKLINVLGDKFDKNKSENENMMSCGWFKIYDCGNMVFTMEFNNVKEDKEEIVPPISEE